jgi:hypothetical protein
VRLSRTRDIVSKIAQIIQDIGLIQSNKNTKATNRNWISKPEQRDLRHKSSPERKGNDERNDEGYAHSEDSTSTLELLDLASSCCPVNTKVEVR